MISKAKIKLIHSLQQKKHRREHGLFVAEGPKVVGDIMHEIQPRLIAATAEWLHLNNSFSPTTEVIEVTAEELSRASLLQAPQEVLALFPIDGNGDGSIIPPEDELVIALDDVQDPGNLGTIIRIADWFGVTRLYCSPNTADIYNPKVVQATMGSLARVKVVYTDLPSLLLQLPASYPVYGTFLDGNSLYEEPIDGVSGMIVMGNEGNGISPAVARHINRRLLIPDYAHGRTTADSLNVAVATAITVAEFRRKASLSAM